MTGGTLATSGFALDLVAAGGPGNLTLAGGLIRATAVNASFLGTIPAANISVGAVGASSPTLDINAFNKTIGQNLSGGGAVNLLSAGNQFAFLTLNGTNTYTGGTNVASGNLLTSTLPGFATPSNLQVATAAGLILRTSFNGSTGFAAADVNTILTDGSLSAGGVRFGLDTTSGNFAYANNIGASVNGFIKYGPNALTLTGNNTCTGGTNIAGGLLNVGPANLPVGPVLVIGGGVLQFAAGNAFDPTAGGRTFTLGAGGGGIDTNGDNVTLAGPIANSSAGAFSKYGTGTLTLAQSLTTPDVFARGGALAFGTGVTVNSTGYSSFGLNAGDNGAVNVNGGTFTVGGDFNIADLAGSVGVVNVAAGSTVSGVNTFLGKAGNGTLNQSGGTYNNNALNIADVAGSTGTVNISNASGSSPVLNVIATLTSVVVNPGGTFTLAAGDANIINNLTLSNATVNVGNSYATAAPYQALILTGGGVGATGQESTVTVGGTAASVINSTTNNAGGISLGAMNATATGFTVFNVADATGSVAADLTVAPIVYGAANATTTTGQLVKTGAGTLALTNAGNLYASGTTINVGTVQAIGTRVLNGTTLVSSATGTGTVTINTGGTLAGTGGTGAVVVTAGGTITGGTGATTADAVGSLSTSGQTWNASGVFVDKVLNTTNTSSGNDRLGHVRADR